MNLSGLLPALRALPEYRAALDALNAAARGPVALALPRAARLPVMAALAYDTHRPTLAVAARSDRALTLADELTVWLPNGVVQHFAEPNPLFYEYEAWGARTIRARLAVLAALANSPIPDGQIIVTSARALMTRTLPKRDFLANTRTLKLGQVVRLEKLIETWVGAGYQAVTTVVEPGQFARRGGIIDIFPAADELPVRLELFGDELDTLRHFDPATQRSSEKLESVTITPAREALPKFRKEKQGERDESDSEAQLDSHLEFDLPMMFPPASLLEYLPDHALVLVDDWRELADSVAEFEEQAVVLRGEQIEAGVIAPDFPLPYHPWADLQDQLTERAPVRMAKADDDQTVATIDLGARFHPGPRYGGQLKPLLDHLRDLHASPDRTIVVTRQAPRLAELWAEHHAHLSPTESVVIWPAEGTLAFVQGALSEGWRLDIPTEDAPTTVHRLPSSVHLLTDSEIFGWARPEVRRRAGRASVAAPESLYSDFAVGDYVVHADFGIGRFKGLVRRAIDSLEREYLWLEYASGDELYVPIHQADRLTRYIGPDEHPPSLSRLGSSDWTTVKSKARQAVEAVAKDLLELYAKRETVQGRPFGPDTTWQAELEASFPYVETEDQLRALREVKADMEKPRPMDRLICGDVGYGKTEVALRAAFKAVTEGAQVAVLVPTTVLAQQHLHTFQSRLAPYPVHVDMLSRFRSNAEAEAIKAQLAEGKIDIVIGTHRLLQKDVQFKNLGLLIIDEEQRFGVTHKEFLKQKRTEVDVLTLTATPIPRTLYMSLTGVRDISTINTPPAERLPIITHVGAYNERLVRQAIQRELDRDGQVFFVHNRVQTIGVMHEKLKRLVPEARIGIGHGQMDEHQLSKVMDQFTEGAIDILLCTSIIESGLDIPNANTLIVDRADTFGLAQLYQLRGRVGRAAQRAYAYFLHESRNRITPEAYQRLETIGEQTELGAGYSIAMRDLEMRGAGDLLGMRQSGQIAAVGFHLYTRLLGEAVRRLKSETRKSAVSGPAHPSAVEPALTLDLAQSELGLVTVDLPLPTSIPAEYVPDKSLRLRLYRRLANLRDEASLAAVSAEFTERFGPLPAPLENLIYQLRVKIKALGAGVVSVGSESGQIVLTLPSLAERENYAFGELGPGVRVSRNKIWLPRAASEGDWREQVLRVLEQLEKDSAFR